MEHLVLFIHGLTGDENTFGLFPKLLREDPKLESHITVDLMEYATRILSIPGFKTSVTIGDLADGLRTDLNHRDEKSIILVCHSLGGLIARRMLLDDVLKRRSSKVKHVFLFATPNEGSELASFAKILSRWQSQLKDLSPDSDFLTRLNEDWHSQEMEKKLSLTYVKAGLDNVVSEKSAKAFWGNNRLESVWNADHSSVVKPESREDLQYKIVRKVLKAIIQESQTEQFIESTPTIAIPPVFLTISQAFEYLMSGDPLKAKDAIGFFSGKVEHKDELLSKAGSVVTENALRIILASYPEESAKAIKELIDKCEMGDNTWHAARNASNLCSVELRPFLEKDLLIFLKSHYDKTSHVLTGLGRIGSADNFYSEIRKRVNSDPDKLLFWGLNSALYSFEVATDDLGRRNCAELLAEFIEQHNHHKGQIIPFQITNVAFSCVGNVAAM